MNKSRVLWKFFPLIAMVAFQPTYAGWWRAYGGGDLDLGYSVQETFDGGYIISGHSQSFGGLWILKTDANGDTLWSRIYEGDINWERTCVRQTSDGGYIATGSGWGLLKIDEWGDVEWHKDLEWEGCWVEQTSDRGYIVAGTEKEYDERGDVSRSHIRLLKTDSRGNQAWSYKYTGGSHSANHVQQTKAGDYVVTGSIFLKVSSTGVEKWSRIYGRYSYSVQETDNGCYVIAGCTRYSGLDINLYLVKTDSAGDTLWTRIYGASYSNEEGYSVSRTSDGGYILTSPTYSGAGHYDLWLLKTDKNGDTLWTRTYGGTGWDWGECVQQTSDGGYIVVGTTVSFSVGWSDIYLLKTDSLGYVGIAEEPVTDVTPSWEATPIGHQIVLKYEDRPLGFHASVFNASGRKVDELHSTLQSGTILWGEGFSPGVYFIREVGDNPGATRKVVLVQ